MPKFFGPNDIKTLQRMSKELVELIIDTNVLYSKMNVSLTTLNFYGLSLHKQFTTPVLLPAMIYHNPPTYLFEYQVSQLQDVDFKFLQTTLQDHNIYPLIGDIIIWRNQMWLITTITNLQLLAGRTDLVWSWVCKAGQVSPTKYTQLAEYTGNFDMIDREI